MKKILIIPLIFTVLSCAEISKNKETDNSLMEKSHFRHLRYLLNVKNETAQKYWPDFGTSDFHQPIVYYSKENTFVVNPTEHILNNFDYQEVDSFNKMRVIQLPDSFNDTSSLKFNNSVSNDSTELHYMQPIMYFQSYELTKKFLQGDLKDLEDWSIMVSHELFHGYQWSKPKMFNQARTVSMPGGPDKFLGSYHKDLDWYKESVEKENDLLKAIWIDGTDLNQNLKQFDSLRNLRIERIKREYDVDIRAAEDYEITIEGNARYFESLIKRYLAENRPDASFLTDEDKKSIVNMFAGYEVSKDKNLFNIYNSRYYYVIGYNISMILEKYEHDFISRINTDEVSLLELLKELKSSQQGI
ncbi:hypothetical protein LCM02_02385 [Lutimonas saemankumensis]|uniref:hypothetical protein n=1 Tax=Lutimonas saemankumensis TaxID=483016 RepID=UPI001CD69E21|nr:hypothetical protein [Lutimonas saemankumensis]MCA0931282.1 hypothetical protein [Lutimonas saemankumensis]